jgi:hypothetical protein
VSLRLRILQIHAPAPDLAVVTAFWAQALSADPVDAPGAFTHLVDATSAVEVHIQSVGDGVSGYHLDLEADDRDAEVARLVGLGGREVAVFGEGYTVVADPAGLPHCIIDADAVVPTPVAPRQGAYGYLDAVLLDVPADVVDAEVAWWAAALDAAPQPPPGPGSPYTELAGVTGPGGPVTFDVQAVGAAARVHVDVSAPDVADEAQRLMDLGATRVAHIDSWIVLADPVGNPFCVVPSHDQP